MSNVEKISIALGPQLNDYTASTLGMSYALASAASLSLCGAGSTRFGRLLSPGIIDATVAPFATSAGIVSLGQCRAGWIRRLMRSATRWQ